MIDGEARAIYERVLALLSDGHDLHWDRLYSGLVTVTVQSLATAARVREGNQASAEVFDNISEQSKIDSVLFAANSSHESLSVHQSAHDWSHDNRTSILPPPFLISAHHISRPVLEWLGDYVDAHRLFYARLRRQVALGSSGESRLTRAFYGRSIISSLTSAHKEKRDKQGFSVAVCLLIESGSPKVVSRVDWDERIVDYYVDEALVELVCERCNAFDGVRVERQLVAIELLSSWAMRLHWEKSEVACSILRLLSDFAKSSDATSDAGSDVGGRSLEAIKKIGSRQTEWRRGAANCVAEAVKAHLTGSGWWTGMQIAAETALGYVEEFSEEDLVGVANAALLLLGRIPSNFWVVIRPLQDFIISPRVCAYIRKDVERERGVLELILRHGTEQESERANWCTICGCSMQNYWRTPSL